MARHLRDRETASASAKSERLLFAVLSLLLLWASVLHAEPLPVSGQFSVWGQVDPDDPSRALAGARYIPEVSLYRPLTETWELGAEAALNLYGFETSGEGNDGEFDADLYRLWVRVASPRSEIRGGLQKISFGSAVLLRPLMWFDSIDPRDPLGLTRGVYGILARHYFPGNANLWVWGLCGNDRLRGWQSIPTEEDEPEYGFRYQTPFGPGEIALSYHHRTADPDGTAFASAYPGQGAFREEAFGLDGKWDMGIGLWFEGCLTRRDLDVPEPPYLQRITVGADYTFDVGNGLHLLAEHLFASESEEVFRSGDRASFSALAADYPLNLFDSLSAIFTYNHENDDLSAFLQWQRTYDAWQVYLSVFHNPDSPSSLTELNEGYAELSGDGIRLMFVYNH